MSETEIKRPENFEPVVKNIINMVANANTFGSYTKQDISQEIWLMCLEALPRFDNKRSLYNFLLTHVKHRLKNLKRNKFFRHECPCKLCSFKEQGKTEHEDGQYCARYLKWYEMNLSKSSLASSLGRDFDRDAYVDECESHEETVARKDLFDSIEANIPAHLRKLYLKLKSGINISKIEREEVLVFLREFTQD